MVTKEITSLQHSLVKQAIQLRLESKVRRELGKLFLSGKKLINDLAKTHPIDQIFYTTDAPPTSKAKEKIHVSPEILKKMTGLQQPDGLAAIAPLPPEQSLLDKKRILVLDGISDPGNLGTLWRTALALGWEGVCLLSGCVDLFNDKALRAAQGATFHLPYEWGSPESLMTWAKTQQGTLLVADLEGTPLDEIHSKNPIALILGNEGQGPGLWAQSLSSKVMIPMQSSTESLNVAAAGAILLYTLRTK